MKACEGEGEPEGDGLDGEAERGKAGGGKLKEKGWKRWSGKVVFREVVCACKTAILL